MRLATNLIERQKVWAELQIIVEVERPSCLKPGPVGGDAGSFRDHNLLYDLRGSELSMRGVLSRR